MIEATIIRYLNLHLDVPVYAERPEKPDDSYVLIERTASSKNNRIPSVTIAIQCYAPSLLSAAALCEQVTEAMENITDLPDVSRCSLNSAYNFTDTATKEYRYQAVFDLVYFE
jgi:hypothetical protein